MSTRFTALLCAIALLFSAAAADAQTQSSRQRRCLDGLVKRASKVSGTFMKDAKKCVQNGARDRLPQGQDAQTCLLADVKGKLQKAKDKLIQTADRSCAAPNVPDFGFTTAEAINKAYVDEMVALIGDQWGDDLEATLEANEPTDSNGRCSVAMVDSVRKVEDKMEKEFARCIKFGLKDGSNPITDITGFTDCLDAIKTDSKQKVSKTIEKLRDKLLSKCGNISPLTSVFPEAAITCPLYGLDASTAQGLADCVGVRQACRLCRMVNDAYGGSRNCSLYDDGNDTEPLQGSCPECSNGRVDRGEECDDGNLTNGDGCTDTCKDEVCGDGVINNNGAEECDNGAANDSNAPDACGDGTGPSLRGACELPFCGDGVTDTGEACDDGADNGGGNGFCLTDCSKVQTCGDGVVDGTETCDDSDGEPCGTCNETCDGPGTGPVVCGDGIVCGGSYGETCDDGDIEPCGTCNSTCDGSGVGPAVCGDGVTCGGAYGETCDDGNTDDGDCCSSSCTLDPASTPCTGPTTDCTAALCDGLGTCAVLPANEGQPCDDGDECTASSECQSGTCTVTSEVITGAACPWVVVGMPKDNTKVESRLSTQTTGSWCGMWGDIGESSNHSGANIVTTTEDPGTGIGTYIDAFAVVDDGDIVTTNFRVVGRAGAILPGIPGSSVSAGQVLAKTPSPTVYDTTGSHAEIQECLDAQQSLLSMSASLDSLPQTADLGNQLNGIPGSSTENVAAVNVGGLNVFDLNQLDGNNDVILNFDGGGSTSTVMILRVNGRVNSALRWQWNLNNGLQPENFLIYSKSTATGTAGGCEIGAENVGGGTLYCPETKIWLRNNTTWQGSVFGGAGGSNGFVAIGNETVLTHVQFTGL